MNAPARPQEIGLEDKYTLRSGRAFMTGTQALVRLPMLQRVRDLAAGLNTGGFISGYRGSPVGGLDQALWKAGKFLAEHHVKFQPGVNEDLAATAIWGTQQVNLFPDAKYDGVFAMWYGKGPGVDRCGDVFKHANSAGTSKHGGVLVLAGDDHAAKSSTLAHQSEHVFKACCIPLLNPSSVQEYLDLGLHGFAMSRFSGCWVAFKCVTDVIESGAVVEIDPQRVTIAIPPDFAMPPGRPEHPLARRVPRAGGAAARLQGLCRARLLPRQQARPHRVGFAARAPRHHHHRQVLRRHAAGACRPRHRRDRSARRRHPPVQGGDVLAARAAGRAQVRRGARGNPRGRGEAPGHRIPDQGGAVQLARRHAAAARGREVRRQRRMVDRGGAAGRATGCCRRTTSCRPR